MDTKSFSELEKIIDHATDAVEFKLVAATLIAMIDKLSFDASYDLRHVLECLIRQYDSKMSIDTGRRLCKVAIKSVSMALQK